MTTYEGREAFLRQPAIADTRRIDIVAKHVLQTVNETVPYVEDGEYDLERALRAKGGCCIAQALQGIKVHPPDVSLAGAWGEGHGHFLLGEGTDISFVDPLPRRRGDKTIRLGRVRPLKEEANKKLGLGLKKLYEETLPPALASGDFVHYYYQSQMGSSQPWLFKKASEIRGETTLGSSNNPHIIVDEERAKRMLWAIGEVTRLRAKHQENFPAAVEDRYKALEPYIPDFIDPLAPIANG